ncbi:MAG: hypothetical protein WC777_03690 [Candidatus Gracilibacteria bacterium]|jgi:hypothetical protein
MFKPLLASFLTGALFLSACGGTGSTAENTGKAMAETACLLFDESIAMEDLEENTKDIMKKYGYSDPKEIDTYLAEIQGTEELNLVSEAARTHLEATCAEGLSASGVSAAELAEAMVRE